MGGELVAELTADDLAAERLGDRAELALIPSQGLADLLAGGPSARDEEGAELGLIGFGDARRARHGGWGEEIRLAGGHGDD